MSDYAWLIPALPALAAAIIAAFGKRMARKGAEVGIAAVALALLLALAIAVEVFSANVATVAELEAAHESEEHAAGQGVQVAMAGDRAAALAAADGEAIEIPEGLEAFVHERGVTLAQFQGDEGFEAGIRIDGLVAMMFLLVTFVSLMVQIYSTGYMHGDARYTYFFALLSVFTASMLLLVIANNLMLTLVGWELVGVCSYLLIGFWWEEKVNSDAAIKAFLTTKLGDVGLIVGVVTLWGMFRTFNITEIITMVGEGVQAGEAALNQGMLTFALLALFLGAVGKSAQFPLHTWLPDAMAGPTPVSALIHAATMVTAGVFLIARLYPLFQASPTAMTVIAVIGAITLFGAGLLALVQDDVKRVLAYSTISQLGYMVAALAFSYTAGIFHLFTHGFFKALLFLGSGSLIHGVHSNNMSDMGGLRKPMPVTFWTFLIGSLALAAIPPLAGFWSKDEILAGALSAGGATGTLVLVLGALGGLVTAFYMTRAMFLIFAGEYRGHGHPHESPASMRWPLVALAVPAALIGFVNLPFDFAHASGFSAWTMFSLEYFESHAAQFVVPLALAASAAAVIGIGLGWRLYRTSPSLDEDPMLRMGAFTRTLQNKYYLDELYHHGVVRPIRDGIAQGAYWLNDNVIDRIVYLAGAGATSVGRFTYDYADQRGIDAGVNGLAGGANAFGRDVLRKMQSGNIQRYAGAMFVGVIVLAIAFAVA
ncbi:MAG TPA: NADH-quinone oxidoreductase subunit L [Egibacteraceae bacterium]|nr:NADH-quinone oxidoreductase subunit L [Egibacteraceae bacterium]